MFHDTRVSGVTSGLDGAAGAGARLVHMVVVQFARPSSPTQARATNQASLNSSIIPGKKLREKYQQKSCRSM